VPGWKGRAGMTRGLQLVACLLDKADKPAEKLLPSSSAKTQCLGAGSCQLVSPVQKQCGCQPAGQGTSVPGQCRCSTQARLPSAVPPCPFSWWCPPAPAAQLVVAAGGGPHVPPRRFLRHLAPRRLQTQALKSTTIAGGLDSNTRTAHRPGHASSGSDQHAQWHGTICTPVSPAAQAPAGLMRT
jgi:hypothetical protein